MFCVDTGSANLQHLLNKNHASMSFIAYIYSGNRLLPIHISGQITHDKIIAAFHFASIARGQNVATIMPTDDVRNLSRLIDINLSMLSMSTKFYQHIYSGTLHNLKLCRQEYHATIPL